MAELKYDSILDLDAPLRNPDHNHKIRRQSYERKLVLNKIKNKNYITWGCITSIKNVTSNEKNKMKVMHPRGIYY